MSAQLAGIKRGKLALFASLSKLPISGFRVYNKHSQLSTSAAMHVASKSMADARAKAVEANGGSPDLPVELDHRWSHKRNAQEGTLFVSSYEKVLLLRITLRITAARLYLYRYCQVIYSKSTLRTREKFDDGATLFDLEDDQVIRSFRSHSKSMEGHAVQQWCAQMKGDKLSVRSFDHDDDANSRNTIQSEFPGAREGLDRSHVAKNFQKHVIELGTITCFFNLIDKFPFIFSF